MLQQAKFKSPCPHRPDCPGCQLIEQPYDQQLATKQRILEADLKPWRAVLKPIRGAAKDSRLEYRNRAKLAVRAHGRFGLYREGSHRLVYIPDCPIHMDRMNELAQYTMHQIQKRRITIYDERQHKGFLRFIIIRQSALNDALMLILVTRTRVFPGGVQLAKALRRKFPGLVGVVQNINEERGNQVEGRENILLAGRPFLQDRINHCRFVLSATSFLQGNHAQAGALYQTLAEQGQWQSDDLVLDLYCGIGLAGLHVSPRVRQVVGVESNPGAIEDARATVDLNQKKNLAFFAGLAEKMLPAVSKRFGNSTAIIVNPPRGGCNERVLHWIGKSSANRLAYISCNPRTLARDLKILEEYGFTVKSLQGFDLYPQTDQVECLAFCQRPANAIRVQTDDQSRQGGDQTSGGPHGEA